MTMVPEEVSDYSDNYETRQDETIRYDTRQDKSPRRDTTITRQQDNNIR